MINRRTAVAAFAATAVVSLSACSGTSSTRNEVPEVGGPLQFDLVEGTTSLFEPQAPGPWTANFGAAYLCVSQPGAEVKLRRVTYEEGPGRGEVSTLIQRGGDMSSNGGFIKRIGDVEELVAEDTDQTLEPVDGAVVARQCGDTSPGFVKAVTSIDVSPEGFSSSRIDIEYTFEGDDFTVAGEFGYVACGSLQADEFCNAGS